MRVNGFWKVLGVLWVAAPVGAVFALGRMKRHRERIDEGKPVGEMKPVINSDADPAAGTDVNSASAADTRTPQPH